MADNTARPSLPIRVSARVTGDSALIKALLTHPMENGLGKTPAGEAIPANFITEVSVFVNDALVASLQTGPGIAADPLFGWKVGGVRVGDTVRVSWRDNQGAEQSQTSTAR